MNVCFYQALIVGGAVAMPPGAGPWFPVTAVSSTPSAVPAARERANLGRSTKVIKLALRRDLQRRGRGCQYPAAAAAALAAHQALA